MKKVGDIVACAPEKRPQFNHKGIGSALLLFALFAEPESPDRPNPSSC
jgi:hypothetical protein